ncbi:SAYSvFN domain-containing protein 1 [Dromaius novaehollandiae]|uniref:SAYSvFN domain-containing protein 1 n=1 Tax=Dromaius novaehollandiae TaxID=8790 RepID=UPI00311FA218
MSAAVERRLAEFRAARGSTAATAPPRPAEPPAEPPAAAAAPEAAEGPQARGGAAAPAWALKVLLWGALLALAAGLGLALPFGLLSGLYWMHAATRGPAERRRGELSAYSVFNPGCAAIPGTLTAAQLERELFYRPAAGSAG